MAITEGQHPGLIPPRAEGKDVRQEMLREVNNAMKAINNATSAAKQANPLAVEVPIIQRLDSIVKELAQSIVVINKLQGL